MLEYVIEGLLMQNDMSGYDMKQNIDSVKYFNASYGSIYPTLKKMETEGLITSKEIVEGGKYKKVYSINNEGKEKFLEWLQKPIDIIRSDNEHLVKMPFYKYLPKEKLKDLVKDVLELNASHAAIADTSKIKFHEEFRKACEKNVCRKYDTNWMGPPAIGPIEELMEKAKKYKQGLLFQTVIQLDSPFDLKGMNAGYVKHCENFRTILNHIKTKYDLKDMLPLNAGCCSVCEKCAYLDKQPCRHPDKAFSSVEAYGMDVMALEKNSGIPIYNGKNTVSYVALILFNLYR